MTGRLLNALPDIVLVPEAEVQGPVMALLTHEVGSDGPAQQVVLDRLLDIALISTLRAWFALQDTERRAGTAHTTTRWQAPHCS